MMIRTIVDSLRGFQHSTTRQQRNHNKRQQTNQQRETEREAEMFQVELAFSPPIAHQAFLSFQDQARVHSGGRVGSTPTVGLASSPPPPLAGLRLSRILAQWAVNSGMGGSLLGHKSCRVFKRGRRVEGTEISGTSFTRQGGLPCSDRAGNDFLRSSKM